MKTAVRRGPLATKRPLDENIGMPEDLDRVWKALADETRRSILDFLRAGPRSTTQIVEQFPELSRFGVMKHIDVLRDVGLIVTRDEGRKRIKALNAVPIRRIYERWVSGYQDFWADTLVRIKDDAEQGGARRDETHSNDRSVQGSTVLVQEMRLTNRPAASPPRQRRTLMTQHQFVSPDQWLSARKDLLAKEKELTRLRDEVSQARRELPWTRLTKQYVFDGASGKVSLADLFRGRSQLIVYHFMFDPEWTEGCKSCSLLADHYDPAILHLNQRDVSMVTVSRAPLEKLLAFQKRMGWSFEWVSSFANDFNRDFHVTFTADEMQTGKVNYNYDAKPFPVKEAPGMSVFLKDDDGTIFHTYSSYERGLDIFIGAYNWLDTVPRGRNEEGLPYGMAWGRHHDRYGDQTFVDPYVDLIAALAGKS